MTSCPLNTRLYSIPFTNAATFIHKVIVGTPNAIYVTLPLTQQHLHIHFGTIHCNHPVTVSATLLGMSLSMFCSTLCPSFSWTTTYFTSNNHSYSLTSCTTSLVFGTFPFAKKTPKPRMKTGQMIFNTYPIITNALAESFLHHYTHTLYNNEVHHIISRTTLLVLHVNPFDKISPRSTYKTGQNRWKTSPICTIMWPNNHIRCITHILFSVHLRSCTFRTTLLVPEIFPFEKKCQKST